MNLFTKACIVVFTVGSNAISFSIWWLPPHTNLNWLWIWDHPTIWNNCAQQNRGSVTFTNQISDGIASNTSPTMMLGYGYHRSLITPPYPWKQVVLLMGWRYALVTAMWWGSIVGMCGVMVASSTKTNPSGYSTIMTDYLPWNHWYQNHHSAPKANWQ